MGKQIQLHMIGRDCERLLGRFAERDPILIIDRDSVTPAIQEARKPCSGGLYAVWNRALQPELVRKFVEHGKNGPYYTIDDSLPLLEMLITTPTQWCGRPALTQGRLYTGFNWRKGQPFERWVDQCFRWVRNNFVKNPVPFLGGYIGPEAFAWFSQGGILLPTMRPPLTEAWLSFLKTQDQIRSGGGQR